MVKLVLCDESPLSRESLSCLLGQWEEAEVVDIVGDLARLESVLARSQPAAVLVVAHGGADSTAVTMVNVVRRSCARCSVVLLVSLRTPLLTVAAWEAGVVSVVDMGSEVVVLRDAIRGAALGVRAMSSLEIDEARVSLDAMGVSHWGSIDPTGRSILACLAEGMPDSRIAERLGLGVQTVRNRVSRLLCDFGMENRTQLAVALTKASITGDGEQMLFAERRERSLFTTRGPVASPTGDAPRDHDVEHVEHVDDAEDVGGPFGT